MRQKRDSLYCAFMNSLVKTRVPGYLEAYESNEVHFAGLEKSKRALEELVDAMLHKANTNLPKNELTVLQIKGQLSRHSCSTTPRRLSLV